MLLMLPHCPALVPRAPGLMSPFFPFCPRIPQSYVRSMYILLVYVVCWSATVARYTDSDRRAGTPFERASNKVPILGKWPSPAISLPPPASPHLNAGRRFAGGHSPTSSICTCLARTCRLCLPLVGRQRSAWHSLHGDTQHQLHSRYLLDIASYPIEPPAQPNAAQPSPERAEE